MSRHPILDTVVQRLEQFRDRMEDNAALDYLGCQIADELSRILVDVDTMRLAETQNAPAESCNSGEGTDRTNNQQEEGTAMSSIPETTSGSKTRRPAWSDPALDEVDDGNQHPDDNITWVNSAPVDEWTVVTDEEGRTFTGREPARVALQGIRHHVEDLDFTGDRITVTGDLMPGEDGAHGLHLTAPTARRLALALLKAAQLLDPDHTWRGTRDSSVGVIVGEYRLNGDVIESYQSHADEWRGCCALNGLTGEAE